ncbi:MAG: helix-turn-helix domain-containing protein [Eubacterium sp.]|nr:helix-turn-helix domain-containing protein [Eubacterium sp.]
MKLRLKDIREDRDIKQVDVATFLNCTQVCYSRYENGQRDIPLNTLCLLAEFFNTTTDYILGLTDNPNKH